MCPHIAKCLLRAKSLPIENHWIKVKEELTCIGYHLISKVYICCGINSSLIYLVNTHRALFKLLGYAVLTVNAFNILWAFTTGIFLVLWNNPITSLILEGLHTWWRAFWNHCWSLRCLDITSAILGSGAYSICLPCLQLLPGTILGSVHYFIESSRQQ